MSNHLKTMSINVLLEEIALSESVSALCKIKKLAQSELASADPDTVKSVERLISYKMRVHTGSLLPFVTKPNSKQLQGLSSLKKLMFYDYASVFFTGYGFEAVVQALEFAKDDPDLKQLATDALANITVLDHCWQDVLNND